MLTYFMKIVPHYSGMLVGRFPDLPDVSVVGRDHADIMARALIVLEEALAGLVADGRGLPRPTWRGALAVTTALFHRRHAFAR
ncbi:MAG: type II toxin-antitoxin system HicB family antitoxin [Sphingomonadaceae bacterium]|nr:type II toxin-antitoxin system HicB family antitoxin [Sphingomonadaceae bacterium]